MSLKINDNNIYDVFFEDNHLNHLKYDNRTVWASIYKYALPGADYWTQDYNVTDSFSKGLKFGNFVETAEGYTCAVVGIDAETLPNNVIIPKAYWKDNIEYTVTEIAESAFESCKSIQTVFIPQSVIYIASKAFRYCEKLQAVHIAKDSKLKHLSDRVFRGCLKLAHINLQYATALHDIGERAFALCSDLTHIEIPPSVEEIGKGAFRWCGDLFTVKFSSKTELDEEGNEIVKGIKKIEDLAFSCCWALQEVYIPKTIEYIGWQALNTVDVINRPTFYFGCSEDEVDFDPTWFDAKTIWNVREEDLWTYKPLNDSTCELTSVISSCVPSDLIIPSTHTDDKGVERTVTKIGVSAFQNVKHIRSVTIPSSITIIDDAAFQSCSRITDIDFGEFNNDRTLTIGEAAFFGCQGITKLIIPEGVIAIYDSAFEGCTNLVSVFIPESVQTLGRTVFESSSKPAIYCARDTKPSTWGGEEDIHWQATDLNRGPVYWGCASIGIDSEGILKYNTWYTFWDGCTAVVKGFQTSDPNLKAKLTIPSIFQDTYTVDTIGKQAFKDCYEISHVTIPDSVKKIKASAFENCSGLVDIDIPDSVTEIGEKAFYGCDNLKKVVIGNGVTKIGDDAFSHELLTGGHGSVTELTIGNNVKSIGDYAFYDCKFTSLSLPDSLESIGSGVFSDCQNLTSINIPNKINEISDRAFQSCVNLETVTIAEGVTSIGDYAFAYCGKLKSITIPDSVTSIGEKAFERCDALEEVVFAEGSNTKKKKFGNYAFAKCANLKTIKNFPKKREGDFGKVFEGWTNLSDDFIANGLIDLVSNTLTTAFAGTTILSSITAIGQKAFSNIDFSLDNIISFIIPENIITIAAQAFFNITGLKEIFIPSSVKYMRANAFKGCGTAQEKITIKCAAPKKPDTWDDDWNPDNLPVVWGCLDNTASDELFTYELLSDNTYSIKAKNKNSLSGRLVIPSSYQGTPVTKIAANGFSGCNVTWVDVLSGIKTIEYGAFKNCSILLDINFPETLEYIGADAFYGCENLTLIQLPNSIKTVETWAFRDCDKAKTIYIPESVEMINNGAFIGVNVDERTIWCENTAAEISAKGWNAAWNAKDITGITKFPVTYNAAAVTDSSMFEFRTTTDGNYYVKPASSSIAREMVVVHVPSSYNGIPVTEIGSFAACKNLVKMILPDSITRLRVKAFGGDRYLETSGCTNLNEINLPNSLKWIGDGAFLGSSIAKLVIPEGAEQSTLSNVFMNCRQLRHITLPESWTEIGTEMFKGCTNLTDIVLPAKCNYIGSNAFLDCENLQNVYLYNKYWNVGDTVLDLTDKSAAEVAQLLTSAEYRELSWSVVKATAPVLHNEFDEHFVDFTVENPNNTPQVLTVSLTLKDGSGDSIEEVYTYSETYTIGANQSITEIFDMPLTEDYSGLMAFSYAELVAYFENSDEIKLILTNNNEVCEQNGHSYIDTIVAPTCTTRGYTRHECKVCGQSYDDSYVEVIEHTCESNTIEPTCTTSGYTEHTCSTCGHYYVDDYVDALGHDWSLPVIVKPATCLINGKQEVTCSRCLAKEIQPIPALGHKEIIDPAVPATCTTNGKTQGSHCSRCGIILVPQVIIRAYGHDWEDATCTKPKTCKTCGLTEGEALGHTWVEADCDTPKTCSVCGATEGSALGHDWSNWSIVRTPTCTKFGINRRECSVCGAFETQTVEALGHNYGEWSITLEPTCTETGTRRRDCFMCDAYETETIAALGHISSDWIIDVEATTETEGSKHKECTRCGVVLETATIPKLPSEDEVNYLTNRDGNYLSDNNGNLLIISNGSDGITYLIDEDGNQITDEQGNLLIL